MRTEPSAYAVLGLEPGADAASIERAYKTLIKRFHPDMPDGDADRAAEINRAYRDLLGPDRGRGDIALHRRPALPKRRRGWSDAAWIAALLAVLGTVAALTFSDHPVRSVSAPIASALDAERKSPAIGRLAIDIMDRPLNVASIDSAVLEAAAMAQSQDEMALTAASRTCHEHLQLDPALSQFDRCAAFDDAVVKLQDRDPLRDEGYFSQLAVTGRLWSAAANLSRDRMATDSRMKQIRVRVELLLAPAEAEAEVGTTSAVAQ